MPSRSASFGGLLVMVSTLVLSSPAVAQFAQQGPKLVGSGAVGNVNAGDAVAVSADGSTAIVGSPNDGSYGAARVWIRSAGAWTPQGAKLVGSDTVGPAHQGGAVSISADGNTAVVGGVKDNNFQGAVWVWARSGGVWTQQGPKIAGSGRFGARVSLSADGNTLLVSGFSDAGALVFTRSNGVWTPGPTLVGSGASGASYGTSLALSSDGRTAIMGGADDQSGVGAAWIFTRIGAVWAQQGSKLVGSGAVGTSRQGRSVAISADGNTAFVGGASDNGSQGAAWVWTRTDGVWTQQGSKLVGSGAIGNSAQGDAVAISADGNTALVGGPADDGSRGALWVWTRTAGSWVQQGPKVAGTGSIGAARLGAVLALASDGDTAVVGGPDDDGAVGAVWVWTRSGGVWAQQGAKLVAADAEGRSRQGASVGVSADGTTAIVGALGDGGGAGAVWFWTRTGGSWTQQGPRLVGSGAVGLAGQGASVSLSADGNTAIVGGQGDNGGVGAAWIFARSNGVWTQVGSKLVGSDAIASAGQGRSVAISADGNTVIVGGYDGGAIDYSPRGAVWVWTRSGGVWTQDGPKVTGFGGAAYSLALSADGSTALVGVYWESMKGAAPQGGVVFTRGLDGWARQGTTLLGSGVGSGNIAHQGMAVALSADGNTAAVGGPYDPYSGAVWIWTRTGGVWTQQGAKLVGAGATASASQGIAVALSADGDTALIGGSSDADNVGAAWVWKRSGGEWTQLGPKLVGTDAVGSPFQGNAVSLSADGHTAVIGGPNDADYRGGVWIFSATAPVSFSRSNPMDRAVGQSDSLTLRWTTALGATSYEYCIDTSNNNVCDATWLSTGANTSVLVSGLTRGTPHYWHVRALNGIGTTYANDAASTFWVFTPAASEPGAFTKTGPANGATQQSLSATLSWEASSGATSYEYCYDSSDNNSCGLWLSTGANTSVVLSGLIKGTQYYWHVRALNGLGNTYANGSATAFWSFTIGGVLPAFGQVDTPLHNASGVVGAIGVTGWALDDTGVSDVKVYRNCLPFDNQASCQIVLGTSVVFVGDAAFLAGARPDVERAFPNHPQANRAGWGYLLLTNMLPHSGNGQTTGGQGPMTLSVIATDRDGNRTLLGRSSDPASPDFSTPTTITMANDSITKPFGVIDTPAQGATVSGVLNNFGWALTPDNNATGGEVGDILIPTNGSTMTVFIDSLPVALVAYNQCRGNVGNPVPTGLFCNDDVANIFGNATPQAVLTSRLSNPTLFRNLDAGRAAIGVYSFNTATLANGLHTIAWSVSDSTGRNEGIGSRFFNVLNSGADQSARPAAARGVASALEMHSPGTDGVWGRTGFALDAEWKPMHAASSGSYHARLTELGRLEVWLGAPVDAGYLVAQDGTLRDLPVGASLQGALFAWAPPAGYVGPYSLAFVRGHERVEIVVTVVPVPGARDEHVAQVRMHLEEARVISSTGSDRTVGVEGWAFDPDASMESGIGYVHVWARSLVQQAGVRASAPFFLGAADLNVLRPDVARAFAGAPVAAGFKLEASLAPGTYELTAYVWNERTARWEDARSLTVIVR
jgi:hypothetical protein